MQRQGGDYEYECLKKAVSLSVDFGLAFQFFYVNAYFKLHFCVFFAQ